MSPERCASVNTSLQEVSIARFVADGGVRQDLNNPPTAVGGISAPLTTVTQRAQNLHRGQTKTLPKSLTVLRDANILQTMLIRIREQNVERSDERSGLIRGLTDP